VLKRIFEPKREEMAGGWRRLHNEELHNLYISSNIIRVIKSRRMRGSGHVARMWEVRNICKILVLKTEGKRPLGKHKRRWEDNIKMDLREIWWEVVDLIHLAENKDQWQALVNTVMNLRVP
jgi:hypothetical protein